MLTTLLLALTTFIINSLFSTLYFTAAIFDHMSKKTIHKDALKITIPGTILSFVFTLLNPFVPSFMTIGPFSSLIDIGITITVLVWVLLIRRYGETSWLEAIMIAALPAIMYIIILFLVGGFFMLIVESGFLPEV